MAMKFEILEMIVGFAARATGRSLYGVIGMIVAGIVVALVFRALRADREAAEARQQAEAPAQPPAADRGAAAAGVPAHSSAPASSERREETVLAQMLSVLAARRH
jgi:hypothetical protein